MSTTLIAALAAMVIILCAACGHAPTHDLFPLPMKPQPQVPLHLTIGYLQRYIRSEMANSGNPGLSIALVRDGQIAWTKGFGVANSITGRPVTDATVFPAGSLGKPVEAYAALKLVQAGKLDLDRPLSSYLKTQFLPPSRFRDRITLETVLTQTSGLSNAFTRFNEDTHIAFDPGTQFAYSGVGFIYLQKVIAAVTGMPFESYMERAVFLPLGMTSSGYVCAARCSAHLANGHRYLFGRAVPMWRVRYGRPLAPSSLYSTPDDMARFMGELMNPRHIDPALIQEMLTPKTGLNIYVSWGLGIALERTAEGECFWQWGDSGDYESYFLGFPAQKLGVVVMTNSSRGLNVARRVAAQAINGL